MPRSVSLARQPITPPFMKKSLIAAISVIMASTACAQSSVTLYGTLDAGLLYQSKNGGPGGGGKSDHSLVMFNGSGNQSANFFGLLGTEDLGGGWKAGFNLQGQFDIGSGALQSSSSLFSQKANIFLENPYGRLTLGKQIDPAYVALVRVDPLEYSQSFSAAGPWYLLEGKNAVPAQTVWESNSASYSYKGHDFSASALYRFGNAPGSLSQGRAISTGVSYDNGTVLGAASFLTQNDSTGRRDLRIWALGAGYRIGDFIIRGVYEDFDLPQGNSDVVIGATPRSHVIMTGGGVTWKITPANSLTAAYYFSENRMDTTNATSSYVLNDDYWLSRRTKLYAFVGLMASKKGANGLTNVITAAHTSGYPGANTNVVGLGIQHKF
ncbi:porin [Caballeronia sp. AZ7_KS35]|uniref:porin n=1 Tax=Caballeronia sp. AZ7_KS35 TaxID=2921762 RepID=UPI00202961FA|nr:porin [Caballeronia sp. AZ7_KS35]